MASVTEFLSPQGKAGSQISLDAGESAIVTFNQTIDWDRDGISCTVFEAAGGEMSVEHSLPTEGDDWSPELGSPFSVTTEIREHSRISRMRLTVAGATMKAQILSPEKFKVVTS